MYTQGKWTKFNDRIEVSGQFHDIVICRMENIREKSANQKLIAAAPDLIEALKGLMRTIPMGFQNEFTEQAKAAISKAE